MVRCQSAAGKAGAKYLVAVTKAVQGCFDTHWRYAFEAIRSSYGP